jgi:hypothetical protein
MATVGKRVVCQWFLRGSCSPAGSSASGRLLAVRERGGGALHRERKQTGCVNLERLLRAVKGAHCVREPQDAVSPSKQPGMYVTV